MKIKITLGGQEVEAQKMEFKPIEETWSLYRLEDDTVVKIKLIVSDVFKLPVNDPLTGMPQFLVKSANVMSVEPSSPKRDVH